MLALHRAGNQDAKNKIIFLHGMGLGGWVWRKVLPYFEDMDCFIIDLPGHGDSRNLPWRSTEQVADDVMKAIGEFDPDANYHIVGHSIGSSVGLSMLSNSPDSFASASFTGIMMGSDNEALPFVRWLLETLMPILKMDWTFKLFLKHMGCSRNEYHELKALLKEVHADTAVTAFLDTMFDRYPAKLFGNKTRALILSHQKSDQELLAYTKKLESFLPNSKHLVLKKYNEFWFWPEPDMFSQTIRACIENTPLPENLRV